MEIVKLQPNDIDLSREPLIMSVKMHIDKEWNRIRITWSCIIESELNLIVVVRTPPNITNLNDIEFDTNKSNQIRIFVYSRKYTDCHLEYLEREKYNYFILPGKLMDKKIAVYMQDGNNKILQTDPAIMAMHSSASACVLHYRWGVPFVGNRLPKKAYINVNRKSSQGSRDIVEYKVSNREGIYKINLKDVSNCLIVPLQYREEIQFLNPQLHCIKKNIISWFIWKYFEHEKGI